MDIAYQLHSLRPYIFDLAGIVLIGSILLYFVYIRYSFQWLAKISLFLFLLGGAPILYFICTGYLGGTR